MPQVLVIDFGQSTVKDATVAKGFGQVQTVRTQLREARAAYDEFEAKTDAEKQAARDELVKGLKKDASTLGFQMLAAWNPTAEVHEKFSVQVKDGDTVFASLEGAFTFKTALDAGTPFISLSVEELDAYMAVGSVKVGVKDGAVALRLNADKTYALMAEGKAYIDGPSNLDVSGGFSFWVNGTADDEVDFGDIGGLEEILQNEFGITVDIKSWLDGDESLHEETLRQKVHQELEF